MASSNPLFFKKKSQCAHDLFIVSNKRKNGFFSKGSKMQKNTRVLIVLVVICLLQACAKSKLVSSWMDEARTGYHTDKILVLGVFKDAITQEIYENSFVDLLKNAGVQAVAGNKYDLGPEKPRKEAIDSALEKSGATSVLITHVISETEKTITTSPADDYALYGGYWDSFHGYYGYVYEQVWGPADTVEKLYERREAILFDAAGGKPVWSARSESVDLEGRLRTDDEQLERLFVADLRKKKIL